MVLAVLAADAGAQQPVLLQIKPRAGDTLVLRLDQVVEIGRAEGADSSTQMSTSMTVVTRAAVTRSEATSATLVAVTDSVWLKEGSGASSARAEKMKSALLGQRVTMQVATDGGAKVLEGSRASDEIRALFTQMPGTLPKQPVSVGDTWQRSMVIPVGNDKRRRGGTVRATFRLDSLAGGGSLAYISMKGTLSNDDKTAGQQAGGIKHEMSGVVVGAIILDRRRGWITDSRTQMTVRSLVSPPVGNAARPVPVRMKVTQRLRTLR